MFTTKAKYMLQDPNVERYVQEAMKPVLQQISDLKAEVSSLKAALHKADVVGSVVEIEIPLTFCPKCNSTDIQQHTKGEDICKVVVMFGIYTNLILDCPNIAYNGKVFEPFFQWLQIQCYPKYF